MDWRRLEGKGCRYLLWSKHLTKATQFSTTFFILGILLTPMVRCYDNSTNPSNSTTFADSDAATVTAVTATSVASESSSESNPGDDWVMQKHCEPNLKDNWPPNPKGKTIVLGFLMTRTSFRTTERLGLKIPGMISYAVETVNNNSILPENYTLQIAIRDTMGDLVISTKHVTNLVCENISAFIGPESTCWVEANIAQAQNLPMISYACFDEKASERETFARTNPSEIHILRATIATLIHFKWTHFCIIHEEFATSMAETLKSIAKEKNFTLNDIVSFKDDDDLPNVFWNTKDKTRIYVLLGHRNMVPHALSTMAYYGLLKARKSEYLLIFVEKEEFQQSEWEQYIFRPLTVSKLQKSGDCLRLIEPYDGGLLVVANTRPEDVSTLNEIVSEYNKRPPFCLNSDIRDAYTREEPQNEPPVQHVPFLPSSHLYDAVVQYAQVVSDLYNDEKNRNESAFVDVERIARDGRAIGRKLTNYTFKSILGYNMTMGPKRESEGSYSVYYFRRDQECGSPNHKSKVPCKTHCLIYLSDYRDNSLDTNVTIPIVDIPKCGYDNQCQEDHFEVRRITLFVLIGAVVLLSFVSVQKYRHWKYKQEILGLQWRINLLDLVPRNPGLSNSTMSIMSNASQEFSTQVFYPTMADHKGTIVCLKAVDLDQELNEKSMKQMRLMRDIKHPNICPFIGASEQEQKITLVTEYCSRGSLEDILENDDITLDNNFISSLIQDLLRAMCFLHHSLNRPHGNLKSMNCVVNGRWVLQVTDYDLYELRFESLRKLGPEALCEETEKGKRFLKSQLWRPPEHLRDGNDLLTTALTPGTKEADVYAFGIILHEIIARKGPFSTSNGYSSNFKAILLEVKEGKTNTGLLRRPNLNDLCDKPFGSDEEIRSVMTAAWAEDKEKRPEFKTLKAKLKIMKKSGNLMDNIVTLLEEHNKNLEGLVQSRTHLLHEEKKITEDLLHRMLPRTVAANLVKKMPVAPQDYDSVTIYFSDIVGFTSLSADSSAYQVVAFLNDLYSDFDATISGYDVYKVETIGDAYMVASGLPEKNEGRHAGEIASMALELLEKAKSFKIHHKPDQVLKLRIGLHTGPVIAGVVGRTMPRYCLFGDTVNTASRMESNGLPLRIHISKECNAALESLGGYDLEERGFIEMKGKGTTFTYWLAGTKEDAIRRRERTAPAKPFFQRYDEFDMNIRPRSPRLSVDMRNASHDQMTPSIASRSIGETDDHCITCGRDNRRESPRDDLIPYHVRRLSSTNRASSLECSTKKGLLSPPPRNSDTAMSSKTNSSGSFRESHSLDQLPSVQLTIPTIPAFKNVRNASSPSSSEPTLPTDDGPRVNFSGTFCKDDENNPPDGDTEGEMMPMLKDEYFVPGGRERADSVSSTKRPHTVQVKNFVQNLLGKGKKDMLNSSKTTLNGISKESHV